MVTTGDVMGDSPARLWGWLSLVLGSVWGGGRGVAGLGLSCNSTHVPHSCLPKECPRISTTYARGGGVWVMPRSSPSPRFSRVSTRARGHACPPPFPPRPSHPLPLAAAARFPPSP